MDNSTAYNKYYGMDEYSYKCIKYLMDNNELVWKLLYYNSADAYKESDLTQEEKGSLIYAGQPDSSQFNVFMDGGSPDVITREDCILRIIPYRIDPDNRTVGTLSMSFEVYSHYKINTMSNYKTRVDVIINEIFKTFNGIGILGIGKLYFNYLASQQDKMIQSGQLPFKGKMLILSTKVA